MLRRSFSHLPGIGSTTEQRLWQEGFDDWQTLLDNLGEASCGSADKALVRDHLQESIAAFEERDHHYFRRSMGAKDVWRTFDLFRDSAVYLDIETDGTSAATSVTVIGLFGHSEFKAFVKEDNLHDFLKEIDKYKMVVSFFGTGFDLPAIEKRFKMFKFEQIHFDLCPALRRVGMQGGLKKIERELGIRRSEETEGLTGYDAVKLWNRYYHLDDPRALDLLVAYNREDVVNLERLADHAYDRLTKMSLLGTLEGEDTVRVKKSRQPLPPRPERLARPGALRETEWPS